MMRTMTRIRSVLEKMVMSLALVAVVGGAGAFWMPSSKAASCTSTDGKATCSGDCCNAGATTCVGGPCAGSQPPKSDLPAPVAEGAS